MSLTPRKVTPRASRRLTAIFAASLTLVVAFACGATVSAAQLSFNDLALIYTQASARATEIEPNAVIAIVDLDGRALLVRRANGGGAISATERAIAVSKAGTAAFLSSTQHAFSSRTAGFIIQQNFPPGVRNTPTGPLVGVGFSNLAFSDVNYFRELNGTRIPGTRLYGSPGGVPLYLNGNLVAGIGVTGDGTEQEDASITGPDNDEAVALAGQIGYAPAAGIWGSLILIDGIRLSYIASPIRPAQVAGSILPPAANPPVLATWPLALFGGVLGEMRTPLQADPLPGTLSGQSRLTKAEVRQIIAYAAARTLVTRAGIRLPAGQAAQVFITVVNNPNQAGIAPAVLGTFRTPGATMFSWDVAVQKARTAVFFSNNTRAFSARTVGFLAQAHYPPGINSNPPGPFNGLQERYSAPLLTGVGAPNPNLPNGITIFPGGFPLYRNGMLVGAIGVSGDGIDQDDLISASGTVNFLAANAIRADSLLYLGIRLPYAKFPRDPELIPAVPAIPSNYEDFQTVYFTPAEITAGLIAGPSQNADGDALSNLLEYAFELDPRTADPASALPASILNPSTHRLQISFPRESLARDLTYIVEVSNNGVTWTPIARSTAGSPVQNLGGAFSITETGLYPVMVTVIDSQVTLAPAIRFLRLRVTRP